MHPRCTGEAIIEGVEPGCALRCQARLARQISCDPPRVRIKVSGGNTPLAVVRALEASLPDLVLALMVTGRRFTTVATQLQGRSMRIGELAPQLPPQTAQCLTAAMKVVMDSSAALRTATMASASVMGGFGGP